jgi:dihydropyrimidinase
LRVATLGGVDARWQLDQPMSPPARMADEFGTATRSAACGRRADWPSCIDPT